MNSGLDKLRDNYDESPYPLNSYAPSAPGQLAAVAHLFGLDVPPVAQARVLEIGCAIGGNLIPFAAAHPHADVVGIDLSPGQIARGRGYAEAIGLDNLHLKVGNVSELDVEDLGVFDYVVCHGVYSWVPDDVRESILSVIGSVLAPDGVAYLSYNVYPGWKTKEIVRDAMLLETDGIEAPESRVRAARDVAEFLSEVALPGGIPLRAVNDYRDTAGSAGDYYLLHEELELFNAPCYFRHFTDRAREHDLAYLGEALPEYMFAANFGVELADRLHARSGDDQLRLQQYLDLAINRSFRQSLLVRAARVDGIRHELDRNRFDRLHFAAWLPPEDGETRLDGSQQRYVGANEAGLTVSDPVHKIALDVVNESWPWTLSRAELIDSVRESFPHRRQVNGVDVLVDELLELMITQGLVRYRLEPVRRQRDPLLRLDESARRLASATRDEADACTFNDWHEMILLEPFDRYLLPLLDGTRDRGALVEEMLEYARQGAIGFQRGGSPITDDAVLRDVLGTQLDRAPDRLAGLKLIGLTESVPPSGIPESAQI
jgi:SAM-dependent methyltransferase/methyltransferase-like protein